MQITSAHPFCLTAVLVAKRVGIPIIGADHTRVPEYARYWARRRWTDCWYGQILTRLVYLVVALWTRLIYAAADLLLVPTHNMGLQSSAIYPNKRIEVVGRGVNTRRMRPKPKDRSSNRALYVGRLSVEKGLDRLAFFDRHPQIELV